MEIFIYLDEGEAEKFSSPFPSLGPAVVPDYRWLQVKVLPSLFPKRKTKQEDQLLPNLH